MDTLDSAVLTHHAVLVRGARSEVLSLLERALGASFTTRPEDDIAYFSYESLGIDDVRALTFISIRKPLHSDVFRIVVAADVVTTEAQHAFLKLLEDPSPHARFVLIVPPSLPLLATLLSRVFERHFTEGKTDAFDFSGTVSEQLTRVGKMVKDADYVSMEQLLVTAEHEVAATQRVGAYARATMAARRYIEARGASAKMLLEQLIVARAGAKLR